MGNFSQNGGNQEPEPRNPDGHQVFEELCALAIAGELTLGERARFELHVRKCEPCQRMMADFKEVFDELVLDTSDGAMRETGPGGLNSFSLEGAQRRLLGELDRPSFPTADKSFRSRRYMLIGLGMAASLAVGVFWGKAQSKTREAAAMSSSKAVSTPARSAQPSSSDQRATVSVDSERLSREVAALTLRLSAKESALNLTEERSSQEERQLAEKSTMVDSEAAELNALKTQLAGSEHQAQVLQSQVAASALGENTRSNDLASLNDEVKDLRASLIERERTLEEREELLSHDRDIRDLIGARNLYMAEVYDVAQTGKTNKPFGRVFYTRDKSLIFYGYDLDQQSHLKQSVVFQGWGMGGEGQNVSLGFFYQDDSKKRWILKCNDAKTLASLNSVFITMEPKGGSEKPTGKRLLTAYLRLEPNHP